MKLHGEGTPEERSRSGSSLNDMYRKDIDGLRAVAVISVVAYHIGLPFAPAGFVGVDVFFVISGYLITLQLWASRETPIGAMLRDFYARRARRIMPSLAVVVCVTLVLGRLLLLPNGEQQDLGQSGIATALFISNVFFWRQSADYFAGPSELQQLLHTWSLAVEEQFYLVWPLLLAAIWAIVRRRPRWRADIAVGVGILCVSIASILVSIAWTTSNPGVAFFMMPSRLWELGTGAALAVVLQKQAAEKLAGVLVGLGLVAIGIAVMLYSRTTPFPGVAALLPVAGTALVIAAGAPRRTGLLYRVLASRPMTLTGEISYSWYLWHWPLLAIARALDMGGRNLARDSAVAVLAYVLGYVSTRYLETPIRKRRVELFASVRASLVTALCLLVLIGSISLALWMSARHQYRTELAPASLSCLRQRGLVKPDAQGPCALSEGENGTIFLVGDSHANHWSPAIAAWAKSIGAKAVERSFTSCPVPLASQLSQEESSASGFPEDCKAFSLQVMAEIEQAMAAAKPTAVILAARWQSYGARAKPAPQLLAAGLDEELSAFERAGAPVLVIGPTPRFEYAIPACVVRLNEQACRLARAKHDVETQEVVAMLSDIVAKHPHARLWNPVSQYCDSRYCYPSQDGSLMFRDADHLSRYGAEVAGANLKPGLDWLFRTVVMERHP